MREKFILPVIIIVALLCGVVGYFMADNALFSGVPTTHEYYATSTNPMTKGEKHLIHSSQYSNTTLGSVIVASTTPDDILTVYDATSTKAVTDGTYSTQVAKISGGTVNTYTFDSLLSNGLVIDLPAGYQGDTILTWRY